MLLIGLIEGALLFQSYLAIQHAAREAARFAVTYQPPQLYSMDQVRDLLRNRRPDPAFPNENKEQWIARRVGYIKTRAVEQSGRFLSSIYEIDYRDMTRETWRRARASFDRAYDEFKTNLGAAWDKLEDEA